MREIKFRGKRLDNGEWTNGSLLISAPVGNLEPQHYFICPIKQEGMHRVDPATIGQYTGLKDKNGREIYEGDIVTGTALSRERTGVIVWIEQLAGFGIRYTERDDPTAWQESSILKDIARHKYSAFCAEIVGNIHDNPELPEVKP